VRIGDLFGDAREFGEVFDFEAERADRVGAVRVETGAYDYELRPQAIGEFL
jgi:hypothetical protein